MEKYKVLSGLNEKFKKQIKYLFVFGFEGCNPMIISKDDTVYGIGRTPMDV